MTQYQGTEISAVGTVAQIGAVPYSHDNHRELTSPMPQNGTRGFMLLDGTISKIHRDRDFGRIEASVTFLLKCPGQPVRPVTIRTNVPVRGNRPLRRRLIEDADHLVDRIVTSPVDLPRVA